MSVKSKELREKRAKLMKDAEAILTSKETLTAEERDQVKKMHADGDDLKAQYELIEANEAAQTELRASAKHVPMAQPGSIEAEVEKTLSADPVERKEQINKAFRSFLRGVATREERAILDAEKRTYAPLQVANAAAGSFVPVGFSNEFDEALKQYGGVMEACRIYATDSGNPLYWPKSDDTANKAVIVAEAGTVAGANPTVDKTTFGAYKYGTLVQATIEQLEDSAFDIEAWLRNEFVVRFGRGINADLTTGDGSGKPHGIVDVASAGWTAADDNTLVYDDMVNLIHAVDPAYRKMASFGLMFNDSTLAAIRLIKDSYGRPIFQADPTGNAPDKILGVPFVINQDMDSLAGSKVVALAGAMDRYVVRKVNGLFVQRLNERYAEQGLVGFLGWGRYDGNIVTASTKAIVKLTMHA